MGVVLIASSAKGAQMKAIILSSVLLMPIQLLAQANPIDYQIQQQRVASEERIATTYGIAIAIAGACIGAGVFFGLRHSGRNRKE